MSHFDVLSSLLDVSSMQVLDIGAGDGAFAKQLASSAAHVTAVEVEETTVQQGNKGAPANLEFRLGRAEALPVADAAMDLACFIFSFHHVPDSAQQAALSESARVLKPGARLHIADPLPLGGMTEIVKPLEDETLVRTRSQARLARLQDPAFKLVEHRTYDLVRVFDSFDEVVARVVASSPARASRLPEAIQAMKSGFDRHAQPVSGGYEISQPCALFHFERC
jgi:ubiquinone/menaquinone biosynthesis C-methylase UbiE